MKYFEFMRLFAVPLNMRAHRACVVLQNLGYVFLVDFGYVNGERIIWEKGLAEDIE